MNKIFITVIILLTLSACASDRQRHQKINVEDNLAKEITPDHMKLFTYSMTMSFPEGRGKRGQGGFGGNGMGRGGMGGGMEGGMGRGGMGGGSAGGGHMGMPSRGMPVPEAMKQRMEERVLQRLFEKIKESSYCREGYKIIDKDIARGNASIRGQCNEPANEADIKKFKTDKPAS